MNTTLSERIEFMLQNDCKGYFTVHNDDGEVVTIRVSDHRGNARNNGRNSGRVLSFVSSNERKQDIEVITDEFIIDSMTLETDGYNTVTDILTDYCIDSKQIINS